MKCVPNSRFQRCPDYADQVQCAPNEMRSAVRHQCGITASAALCTSSWKAVE